MAGSSPLRATSQRLKLLTQDEARRNRSELRQVAGTPSLTGATVGAITAALG
jgi:hypothetical protein